jgi:hypothetical protein
MTTRTAYFNRFSVEIPIDAICSHQGRCDDDVAHWAPKVAQLNPELDPGKIRAELNEYGAWDADELADDAANWERLTWVACGDLAENQEDEGLAIEMDGIDSDNE